MKKSVLLASAAIMMCYFTSCSGGKKTEEAAAPAEEAKTEAAVPEYKLMNDRPVYFPERCRWQSHFVRR